MQQLQDSTCTAIPCMQVNFEVLLLEQAFCNTRRSPQEETKEEREGGMWEGQCSGLSLSLTDARDNGQIALKCDIGLMRQCLRHGEENELQGLDHGKGIVVTSHDC